VEKTTTHLIATTPLHLIVKEYRPHAPGTADGSGRSRVNTFVLPVQDDVLNTDSDRPTYAVSEMPSTIESPTIGTHSSWSFGRVTGLPNDRFRRRLSLDGLDPEPVPIEELFPPDIRCNTKHERLHRTQGVRCESHESYDSYNSTLDIYGAGMLE
jgi:hypothetical protein